MAYAMTTDLESQLKEAIRDIPNDRVRDMLYKLIEILVAEFSDVENE